jgi:hypothetical protein
MRIAICLSGQLRTGLDAVPSLLNYIGDLLPQCDFFIHTWDTESYSNIGFGSKRYDDAGLRPGSFMSVNATSVYNYAGILNARAVVYNNFNQWANAETKLSSDPHLYSVRQSNNLKIQYEKENNFKYSAVVRTRPDLIYDPTKTLLEDISHLDSIDRTFCYAQCYDSPDTTKIDNAFWVSSSYVMDQVTNFESIKEGIHPQMDIDGFMHFENWVSVGLRFDVKRLQNSRIAVYRELHKDLNKHPINDFEYVFNTLHRP